MPPFFVVGIDHVALTVSDVGRSVAWYQDVLGLERWHEDVWGDFPAIVGAGTTALALFPPRAGATATVRDAHTFDHIAFRVDRKTFERTRAHLEARGLAVTFQDHTISHSLYFFDPDGYGLEITTNELR